MFTIKWSRRLCLLLETEKAEQQRAMAHEKKELYQADKEMVEMMKRDDAQYVMGPDGTMTMRDLQL